jgi:hypothetical protein
MGLNFIPTDIQSVGMKLHTVLLMKCTLTQVQLREILFFRLGQRLIYKLECNCQFVHAQI